MKFTLRSCYIIFISFAVSLLVLEDAAYLFEIQKDCDSFSLVKDATGEADDQEESSDEKQGNEEKQEKQDKEEKESDKEAKACQECLFHTYTIRSNTARHTPALMPAGGLAKGIDSPPPEA